MNQLALATTVKNTVTVKNKQQRDGKEQRMRLVD